jgi:exonuclease III
VFFLSTLFTVLLYFFCLGPTIMSERIFTEYNISNPNLSFSTINCNSLNVSTVSSLHQQLKVYGICKLRSDIIFLADTRLNSDKNPSALKKIESQFSYNPYSSYDVFHNSKSNARGVCILIKKNLNIVVAAEWRDSLSNILGLRITTPGGANLLLIAIYGPNSIDKKFFDELNEIIRKNNDCTTLIAGDWNCTLSTDPEPESNIDIINMRKPPNITHSILVNNLCSNFNLVDPFRVLYPNSRSFTFVPKCASKINRSQLDFFIISRVLVPHINCSTQNRLFDHKAVNLTFKPKKTHSRIPTISNLAIDDSVMDILVKTSVFEHYIHQALTSISFDLRQKNLCLELIGLVRAQLKSINSDIIYDISDEESQMVRQKRINYCFNILNDLEAYNIQSLEPSCEDDIFLESMINFVRNDIVSYQTFISKSRSMVVHDLEREMSALSGNFELNQTRIFEIEKMLSKISDRLMRSEVERNRSFEAINNKKITPFTLRLLKSNKKESSLLDLKKDDGFDFGSEGELSEYVKNYFSKIYEPNFDQSNVFSGCIEKFLGEEIVNSNLIKESKVTVTEKNKLEAPLTLFELDKQSNKKSAPGIDGLSAKFVARFWNFFQIPLHKYALRCFQKGQMTHSFRSACIRLIPKKGDPQKITNWRPISLLSNLYKVISRALNNRLKIIVDRVTSRAQKGFTSSRYLQEVLINVTECIADCNVNKKSGAIITIDQAKAFDTLDHRYLEECYRFFNIGENFISMLSSVGNNRQACILLDSGNTTAYFPLKCGRPQGENLSPIQYNIGNQILLLKIELNPIIKSLIPHFCGLALPFLLPQNNLPVNSHFNKESNRETNKAEGFADDSSDFSRKRINF